MRSRVLVPLVCYLDDRERLEGLGLPLMLALPLVADRLGTTLSTEGVLARLRAILAVDSA